MQIAYRFLAGGLIVSLFSLLGDVLRPKGFAGLFGAAPSVALATLPLLILSDGRDGAAVEARSMVAGAFAFFLYALACTWVLSKKHWKVTPTALGMLSLWALCAFGGAAWLLRSP